MKINNLLKQSFLVLITASFFIFSSTLFAEAQRGQPMTGQQYERFADERWDLYGPGRMGGQEMPGPGTGMMPGIGRSDLLMLPGLTEEQRESILSIERETRRQHRELMLDIMDRRDDLMEALDEDRPDPGKVRELHEALNRKQGEMVESSIKTRNRIYDLLDEEQRMHLRELQQRPFDRPYRFPGRDDLN